MALAGGASFGAAQKLPSGDVAIVANSAAVAELFHKHTEWLRAFGPGSTVQEPSWGVVSYNIPVRLMELTPETMADVARELLAQNDWGEATRIPFLGWLTRPGALTEGSILIDFTSPVVANRAIITGVMGGKQIHHAVCFCRKGRQSYAENSKNRGISSHAVPTTSNLVTLPMDTRPGSVHRQRDKRHQLSVPIAVEDIVQLAKIAR